MADNIPPRIERLPAVLARTGLSRSSLYAAVKQSNFPAQVRLSSRAVGFLAHEVDAWIAGRAAQRSR